MEKDVRNKIIEDYKSGLSSLKIAEKIGLSKPTILKVLRQEKLVRKKDRCESIKIKKNGEYYFVERLCPMCKNTIQTKSKDKSIACRNHFNKLKGTSLCKSCSLKLQAGEGNPFYGKKHSDKSKQEISKNKIGKNTGEKNSMANKKCRKKAGDAIRKKWKNGEMEHVRKIFSDTLKETRRLGKIKSCNVSKKEGEIIKIIEKMGYEVLPSYQVDTKICDIYIPKLNLIVEYNGDYWHCNPKKYKSDYFNQKKQQFAKDIWEYDRKKLELVRSYGYNLEVVWETDLKHDNNLIKKIINIYDKSITNAPERSRKD